MPGPLLFSNCRKGSTRNSASSNIFKREESLSRLSLVYSVLCVMHDVSSPTRHTKISSLHPGSTLHTLLDSHTDSSETQFPKSISAGTSSLSIGLQKNNGRGSFGVFRGNPAQVTGGHFICRRWGVVKLISLSQHKINSTDNGKGQVVVLLSLVSLGLTSHSLPG